MLSWVKLVHCVKKINTVAASSDALLFLSNPDCEQSRPVGLEEKINLHIVCQDPFL